MTDAAANQRYRAVLIHRGALYTERASNATFFGLLQPGPPEPWDFDLDSDTTPTAVLSLVADDWPTTDGASDLAAARGSYVTDTSGRTWRVAGVSHVPGRVEGRLALAPPFDAAP